MTPKEILEELDNNKMDLSSLVEEVKENICDNYCKYPGIYDIQEDDDDDITYEKMVCEVCDNCPLNYL